MAPRKRYFFPGLVLVLVLLLALDVAAAAPSVPLLAPTQGVGTIHIDGIGDRMAEKIRPALSIARLSKVQRKRISEVRLAFMLRRTAEEARRALMPLGYYHAQVDVRSEPAARGTDVYVHVDLGDSTQVRERTVRVDGAAQTDRVVQRSLSGFEPTVGQRFVDERYEASKRRVDRVLSERGYFDATLDCHEVRITRVERAADITLSWTSGPRYTLGAVHFEGGQLRPELLAALTPWQAGAAYRQDHLITLQSRLAGLDYFSVVMVQPAPERAQAGVVPVEVALTPAKRNVYSTGLSYGTDSGAGVRFGAERRWLNDRGHKAKIELDWAQRKRTLATQYRIPAFARFDGWYTFNANLREDDFGAFENSRTIEVAGSRTARFGEWGLAAGVWAQRQSFSVLRAPRTVSTVWYPEVSVQTLRARDPINPRNGWSLAAKVRGNSSALGSDVSFLQAHLLGKWIIPLASDSRLLLRGELGATRTDASAQLPPNLRFFAGGDQSIRGFDYNAVGVGMGDGAALGGKHLAVASIEVDHYFNAQWGVAAFVDAGDAFNDAAAISPAIGAGLGLRWRSPVGPVRLDLARAIDSAEQGWRVHLRIGPDL